ncbi:MAG: TPM domain-containing protein, partial [Thermoanaerobaculia bacterium]
RLDAKLAALEKEKGAQMAVLTVESLEGEVLEDYAMRVVETWKLGREKVDDGVLLLIAEQDRKMRLEVGYGLEGALTDLESRQILDQIIRPAFRRGDFAGGIEAGVDAIAASVRGEPLPQPEVEMAEGLEGAPWYARLFIGFVFCIVVGVFSLSALAGEGCGAWGLYVFLMPFYFAFPTGIFDTPIAGLVAWLAWAIGYPLLRRWRKTEPGKRFWTETMGPTGRGGRWFTFPSGGGGGWSGGGGGFSGGGGGFGGGGASSGW